MVQISLTAKEKRKKETAGALERVARERKGEEERERGKKKQNKKKSSFINAVSIITDVYMQYSGDSRQYQVIASHADDSTGSVRIRTRLSGEKSNILYLALLLYIFVE